MGLDDGGDFWSQQRSGDLVEKKIAMSSMAACRGEGPSSAANSFFSANIAEQGLMGDWNLLVSMAQHMDFNGFTTPSSSGVCVQENGRISASGASLTEQIPSFPCFNGGDISQIMSSTSLSANGQIGGPLSSTDFNSSGEHGNAKNPKGKKRRKMPEYGALDPKSPFSSIQTAEDEQKKDVIPDSVKTPREEDVKKEEGEQNPGANPHKLASKQAKGSSSKGSTHKEDYIHLRAKRGHAINSHSLAERVRRQKISERMKFLQDLVPGCSKITGKAVMLDEIINYIQSLQRQVEFLSMKLAAVNPELNLGVEQILSKDVLHSQTGASDALGFCPGFISSHPHSQRSVQEGAMQAEMAVKNNVNLREELKSAFPRIAPLPQISNVWQYDVQNVTQMRGTPSGHLDARNDPPGSTET